MPTSGRVDERIAITLDASRTQMAEEARGLSEQRVRTLVLALRLGRWGSWWCQFSDSAEAVRQLTDIGRQLVPHLLRGSDPAALVRRLIEVVGDMAAVLVTSERAGWEREAHQLRQRIDAKDDMLRLAVHELRGPVSKLRGYLSLLSDGDATDQSAQIVAQAQIAADQLVPLIDGLAAVVRLEDGVDILRRRPCRLAELVDKVLIAVRPEGESRNVALEQRVDGELVATVDSDQLHIAIANLVSNAIRYAPVGSCVRVETELRGAALAIAVSDQGPGMEPHEAAVIFEAHRRGASAQGPGMGLGLYIVRRIVEAHGGTVQVASTPGQGATFTILLPP